MPHSVARHQLGKPQILLRLTALTEIDFPFENLCWTLAILQRDKINLGLAYQMCVTTESAGLAGCDGLFGTDDDIVDSSIIPGLLRVCFKWG